MDKKQYTPEEKAAHAARIREREERKKERQKAKKAQRRAESAAAPAAPTPPAAKRPAPGGHRTYDAPGRVTPARRAPRTCTQAQALKKARGVA